MECVDGPDADPFIAAFPTSLPNSFTVSQMTVPAAQYTADAANSVSNGPSLPKPYASLELCIPLDWKKRTAMDYNIKADTKQTGNLHCRYI
jgi:hypothetical protein